MPSRPSGSAEGRFCIRNSFGSTSIAALPVPSNKPLIPAAPAGIQTTGMMLESVLTPGLDDGKRQHSPESFPPLSHLLFCPHIHATDRKSDPHQYFGKLTLNSGFTSILSLSEQRKLIHGLRSIPNINPMTLVVV
jgi:hypothetical protein